MKKQQTAVEWFAERIQSDKIFNYENVLKQAKQMEKDQIEMAHYHNRCIDDQSYDCTMKAFYDAQEYYLNNYES
jgi:hypothetical protein